ncbi:MAG: hypothetical protein KKF30_10345 [Proteobacteria bacterium]|nr:hypothetical protein [Pseudomonadota bacterium]MBU4469287.1 hypothetical protein [Pseudomonadota bacterium]MCG2750766.1 hypothetical protein [Desulfobacteraceae bacterium]
MTLLFHMTICVAFVIIQTTLLPSLFHFTLSFDLFLPMVIYMGLFRSVRESVIPLLFQGIVMDSLSGAPLGIYTSCYLWLFAVVYWFKGFLHIRNHFFLAVMVCISVVVQHVLLVLANDLSTSDMYLFLGTMGILLVQILLALVFGPLIILWIQGFYERWRQLLCQFSSDQ